MFFFPALNSSNTAFATIDYEALINPRIDSSLNYVLEIMTVAELKTIHTTCYTERTQLSQIRALTVERLQRKFTVKNIATSSMLKTTPPGCVCCLRCFSLL